MRISCRCVYVCVFVFPSLKMKRLSKELWLFLIDTISLDGRELFLGGVASFFNSQTV